MGPDFFYEGEEDDFSFIRIPKVLFSSPSYADLTNDARMLYGLILDRMTLSRKNGWTDENGRIYIVFTVKAIEKEVSVGHTKAAQLLDMTPAAAQKELTRAKTALRAILEEEGSA